MDVRLHYLFLLHSSSTACLGYVPSHRTIGRGLERWVLLRRYWDTGEDIDSLADSLGAPREEVSDYLRGWTGDRFLTLRKRLRVHDAGELLLSRPELPAADIARLVGFQDKSDFRRAFVNEKGMPPRLWRECKGSRLRLGIRRFREAGRSRCP